MAQASLQPRPGDTVDEVEPAHARTFVCPGCAAELVFVPGSARLCCGDCGLDEPVETPRGPGAVERDLAAVLAEHAERRADEDSEARPGSLEVFCPSCGAIVCFDGPLSSAACEHCGGALERDDLYASEGRLPVDGVLPFVVERDAAHRALEAWARSRWFAPRGLAQRASAGRFAAVFVPYFTFDVLAAIRYEGDRGEAYVVEPGGPAARRNERTLHWTAVNGSFQSVFDDVPVAALESLPPGVLRSLEPWPLEKLESFAPGLLAGVRAHTYEISLREAFGRARTRIRAAIDADVRRRIGGDAQHVLRIDTGWVAGRYRHLLLPLWVLVYRVRGRPYRALINAVTGEVTGERPWSTTKLLLAGALAVSVAGFLALLGS
jgi:ribosomal protein S27E